VVNFHRVIPSGNKINDYYGVEPLPDKKTPKMVDLMNDDGLLSYFYFNDVAKVLP
jgi:hypothetical protein